MLNVPIPTDPHYSIINYCEYFANIHIHIFMEMEFKLFKIKDCIVYSNLKNPRRVTNVK